MNIKKFFKFTFIMFAFLLLSNYTLVFASDIDMNLNTSNSDDTVYGSSNIASNSSANTNSANNNSSSTSDSSSSVISVGSSSGLSSSDLDASTIINIILIVLGVLLILLGIAILIRIR